MVDVTFNAPTLDPNKRPEDNIATVDRWIQDTVVALNRLVHKLNQELEEQNG